MIKFKFWRDPKKNTSPDFRDTRTNAYRNVLTLLSKPWGLVAVFFLSWLLSLYALNLIIGIVETIAHNTNLLFHNQSDNKLEMYHVWYTLYLQDYPFWLTFGLVVFFAMSVWVGFKTYFNFRALEDIQNTNSNQWASTEDIIKSNPMVRMNPNVPYNGVGGVPIAFVRPSVLKKFKVEMTPFFDDAKEEDKAAYQQVTESLAAYGLELDEVVKKDTLLRSELSENLDEYAIFIADEATNVIALGITRSGKGVFFVNSVLDMFSRTTNMDKKASFFMADTKGIALRENYEMLISRGYEVLVFNTADPFFSNPFSPLFTATYNYEDYLFDKKLSQVERFKKLDFAIHDLATLANTLYIRPKDGQAFFVDNAKALFRASSLALIDYCLHTNQKEKISLYTVSKTIAHMMGISINRKKHPYLERYISSKRKLDDLFADYKDKTALDVYFGEMSDNHPAKDAYGSIKMAGGASETLAGIASELLIQLDPYMRRGTARLTSENAFDFRKLGFGEKPQAIFLIFPDSNTTNEELATLFIEQSFQELVREADMTESGSCPRTVIYLLDEFGNLMKIPDMGKKMSSALSRNIRFHLILQNLGQLDIYERSERETMEANAGLTFYIKSNDKITNEEITSRLGKVAVASYSRQGGRFSNKKTENESVEKVDMMARHELEQLQFGENVIMRISKTATLDNQAITQYPIINRGKERMVPSYWYLKHRKVGWGDIPIDNTHVTNELKDMTLELYPIEAALVYLKEKKEEEQRVEKEKEKQAISEEEQVKSAFKKAMQKEFEGGKRYFGLCTDALSDGLIQTICDELFTTQKIIGDAENLQQGLSFLKEGSLADFTQWLEMENNTDSIEFFAQKIGLEGWEKQ